MDNLRDVDRTVKIDLFLCFVWLVIFVGANFCFMDNVFCLNNGYFIIYNPSG